MKAKDVILKVRQLCGYQSSGIAVTQIGDYKDALLYIAMDNAIDKITSMQPRELLKNHRYSVKNILGNDLLEEPYVYREQPDTHYSNNPTNSYPLIASSNQKSRVAYFYYDQSNFMSPFQYSYISFDYKQYLNSISTLNYESIDISPNQTKDIDIKNLSTFLFSVEFFDNTNNELVDAFEANLITQEQIDYFSKVNINMNIDYKKKKVTLNYSNVQGNSIKVKFYTNESVFTPFALLKDGRIRLINASAYSEGFIEIQSYDRPYTPINEEQLIPDELSGDLFHFFIASCCYELQILLKSLDSGIERLYNEAKNEFLLNNSLKTVSRSNNFLFSY